VLPIQQQQNKSNETTHLHCRAFLYLVGRVGEKPRGSKAATAAQMAQRATRQGEEFGSAKF